MIDQNYNECEDCPKNSLCDRSGDYINCDPYVVFDDEAAKELEKKVFILTEDSPAVNDYLASVAENVAQEIQISKSKNNNLSTVFVGVRIQFGKRLHELKEDVNLAQIESWSQFFIRSFSTDFLRRSIENYIILYKANIHEKYHSLGVHALLKIVSSSKISGLDFNEFMEVCLTENDLRLRKSNDEEWSRLLKNRSNFGKYYKMFLDKQEYLTVVEAEALRGAVDNGYAVTEKELLNVIELKKSGNNLVNIFKNKYIPEQKTVSGGSNLNLKTEFANFVESLEKISILLKSSDKDLLLEIDHSLLSKSADNIGSVEKLINDIIERKSSVKAEDVDNPLAE